MLDRLRGFHLEPTNICTLKCPRCPRTMFLDSFKNKNWTNANLNLNDLRQFIDIDIKGLIFGINGNYGDPIYYPDLFDLIKYIKKSGGMIKLHTNGSYKSREWWQELAELLDKNDIINFSIDGLPENFTKYRINADWDSISEGIAVLVKSPATIVWKYIVFSYNENDIETARALSKELGMTDFIVNNSDRWEDNDWLKPTKYVDIDDKALYNGSFNGNRGKLIDVWKKDKIRDLEIDAVCKNTMSMHFISAQGYYMPCCWVGDHRFYYSSEFYKNKDQYDISKTTMSQVLNTTQQFYSNLEINKLKYCTFNCSKHD